jgi:HPt (histidine-containing phosphotransfer) domain-containing protein
MVYIAVDGIERSMIMTLKECYEAMGADYEEVMSRLRTEERVQKFLLKLLSDPSYGQLCTSMENRDMAEAFRGAHTLKGISQNLSLTRFGRSVTRLSDYLKEKQEYNEQVEAMMAVVKEDYESMISCIKELQKADNN